jgi:hypothetical protein
MPFDEIYRFSDPNFGINNRLNFLQAVNLNLAADSEYASAMEYNHYRKPINVGAFTYAQAVNPDQTIRYEVVYCPMIDDLVNPSNVSPSISDPVPFPPAEYNGVDYSKVYPNSLHNMRQRLYNAIQQANQNIPLWMSSVQKNGQVLGFTPAWVVCYAQPGYGAAIAYRLNQQWANQLYQLYFVLDRYELDNVLTYRYETSGSNIWYWGNSINVMSPVVQANGNILFANVYNNSLTPQLNPGDIIAWSNNNTNVTFTTGILNIGPNTPVTNISVVHSGAGYSAITPPKVTIAAPAQGGGTPATANAQVAANGTITSITLTSPGLGYHTPPKITIAPPPSGRAEDTATATANISVSPLTGIYIVAAGDRYLTTPTVTIQPPLDDPLIPNFNANTETAQAKVTLAPNLNPVLGDSVSVAYLTSNGLSYTSTPTVTVTPSIYGNSASLGATINYEILVGNSEPWKTLLANAAPANVWLYNQYVADNSLNKYYLFPQVNVLQ